MTLRNQQKGFSSLFSAQKVKYFFIFLTILKQIWIFIFNFNLLNKKWIMWVICLLSRVCLQYRWAMVKNKKNSMGLISKDGNINAILFDHIKFGEISHRECSGTWWGWNWWTSGCCGGGLETFIFSMQKLCP